MNTENIKKLIALLETGDVVDINGTHLKFNMDTFGESNECGTSACIAGWAAVLGTGKPLMIRRTSWGEDVTTHEYGSIGEYAGEWLGLDAITENDLFYGEGDGYVVNLNDIDRAWAIRTLKHLLETGEVDWRVANTDGKEIIYND